MPIAREQGARHERASHQPTRTCVGCRVSCAQDDLLRLHLVPVAQDEDRRRVEPAIGRASHRVRTGRSAYVCPRRSCLDQAIKRRALTRAFSSRTAPAMTQAIPTIQTMDAAAADALWATAIAQVRREIQLFDRSSALSSRPESRAANPHAQPRRRGLERLLSELECSPIPPTRPTPPDRHPRSNGQGGAPTHG